MVCSLFGKCFYPKTLHGTEKYVKYCTWPKDGYIHTVYRMTPQSTLLGNEPPRSLSWAPFLCGPIPHGPQSWDRPPDSDGPRVTASLGHFLCVSVSLGDTAECWLGLNPTHTD